MLGKSNELIPRKTGSGLMDVRPFKHDFIEHTRCQKSDCVMAYFDVHFPIIDRNVNNNNTSIII